MSRTRLMYMQCSSKGAVIFYQALTKLREYSILLYCTTRTISILASIHLLYSSGPFTEAALRGSTILTRYAPPQVIAKHHSPLLSSMHDEPALTAALPQPTLRTVPVRIRSHRSILLRHDTPLLTLKRTIRSISTILSPSPSRTRPINSLTIPSNSRRHRAYPMIPTQRTLEHRAPSRRLLGRTAPSVQRRTLITSWNRTRRAHQPWSTRHVTLRQLRPPFHGHATGIQFQSTPTSKPTTAPRARQRHGREAAARAGRAEGAEADGATGGA